jgi:para-aminobenzoate synthetase/4-amino-4-deoxychorismate lyase
MNRFENIVEEVICAAEEFAIFETLRTDEDNFTSYIFIQPRESVILTNEDVEGYFSKLEDMLDRGFYVAGFLSYELGYLLDFKLTQREKINPYLSFPLAFFYAFDKDKVITFDHRTGEISQNAEIVEKSLKDVYNKLASLKYKICGAHLNVSKKEYIEKIKKIKSYISSGDTYQINYTIKLKFAFEGSLLGLYRKLRQAQRVSYSAFIKTDNFSVISFSPELFFRKINRVVTVKPMKGTIDRGRDIYEDKIQAERLHKSIKNRAENVMIVDLLRNDLGKLSPYGKVAVKKLFEVEKYETLFQMTSTIQAELSPNVNLYRLFYSIFPSGSVTGAPKIRSMEIIKELEKEPRNVYTGAIGIIKPNREAIFNVAIRTLLINNISGESEMGIGSGIVIDSNPYKEFEECKLKYKFLIKKNVNFMLIETILYSSAEALLKKVIKDFHGLALNISEDRFQNGYFLLNLHIERIRNSALYFGFKFNEEEILHKLHSLKRRLANGKSYKVRLLLSRSGSAKLQQIEFDITEFCSQSIAKIGISDKRVDKENIFLYHKTTNRRLYNKEYSKFSKAGFFDVLFLNKGGEVCETSRCNIFIKKGNLYYTPWKSSGILEGVFRRYLIKQNKEKIEEKALTIDDIFSAEKVFITNAVIGIREAKIVK